MTDTELAKIDEAIALGRRRVISAQACGDEFDAELYETAVDQLLSDRWSLMHPPL